MSNVLQILSSNYSGKSVNITFTPLKGDIQKFDNVSLPYNFINDTFDGNYTLFFPEYNLTHKFEIPTPPSPPVSLRCRCTEFNCRSFLNEKCTISFTGCDGTFRSITMAPNTSRRDCIKPKSEKISKNATSTYFGYCDSVRDCSQLTQPVTPTPTKTPTPTPQVTLTHTPSQTLTPTQTQSFTPSVTPTTSLGVTGECMCTTIKNLNDFEINISFNLCKYPDWGNPYVISPLSANEEYRVCAIYNTVSGDNISVTYEYGVCEFDGAIRSCPLPTPTPTPTSTPPELPPSILISGVLNFNNQNQASGVFKYNMLENSLQFLNIVGTQLNGLAHTYNQETSNGKIWTKRQGIPIINEYIITDSSYSNSLNRTISLTGTNYGSVLTYKDDNTLIGTKLIDEQSWIIEININPNLNNPIDTEKFSLYVNIGIVSDIMYTNNNKLIIMNEILPDLYILQYDYQTGHMEFLSTDSCCRPSALFQYNNQIYSAQSGAGQRIRYDLNNGLNTFIYPLINCGQGMSDVPIPNECYYSFLSSAGSSLLINNTASFVPNQPE